MGKTFQILRFIVPDRQNTDFHFYLYKRDSMEWRWNERGAMHRGCEQWFPQDEVEMDGLTWVGHSHRILSHDMRGWSSQECKRNTPIPVPNNTNVIEKA